MRMRILTSTGCSTPRSDVKLAVLCCQDVEMLVHMARRRCVDDKAAVRKAGLQLLEALLMMRAQGAGGADPELPSEQDIRALEAATADALVRGSFLVVLARHSLSTCKAMLACADPET